LSIQNLALEVSVESHRPIEGAQADSDHLALVQMDRHPILEGNLQTFFKFQTQGLKFIWHCPSKNFFVINDFSYLSENAPKVESFLKFQIGTILAQNTILWLNQLVNANF
jgi:hypothetical protein